MPDVPALSNANAAGACCEPCMLRRQPIFGPTERQSPITRYLQEIPSSQEAYHPLFWQERQLHGTDHPLQREQ